MELTVGLFCLRHKILSFGDCREPLSQIPGGIVGVRQAERYCQKEQGGEDDSVTIFAALQIVFVICAA